MKVNKKRQQLLTRLKKRQKNGIAKPIVAQPLQMKSGERSRFTKNNALVLLAIERTIIALADGRDDLDDRCVRESLVSSIRDPRTLPAQQSDASALIEKTSTSVIDKDETVENDLAVELSKNLRKRYESFFPANDSQTSQTWKDGLRAIYTSMGCVSDFAPGECSYLQSARGFLGRGSDSEVE
jgi:hypothetical protein